MKSNSYSSILLGVLAATAIFSLVVCGWYILAARQVRAYQGQLNFVNIRQAAVRQLIEETADYARKTNSKEAVQILETIGVRLVQNTPGTPSTK